MVRLTIVGTAPYISQAWSETAIRKIQDKQSKAPRRGPIRSGTRDPNREFEESIYRTKEGAPGINKIAVRAAMIDAAPLVGIARPLIKAGLRIGGSYIIPIRGSRPQMRTDMRRLPTGSADPVYRAEFWPWEMDLELRYDAHLITLEQVINLVRRAGFSVGIGGKRPMDPKGKGDDFGTFDLKDALYDAAG